MDSQNTTARTRSLHAPAAALRPVVSNIAEYCRKVGSYAKAFCLTVGWLLLLLVAIWAEMTVVFAIGSAARMIVIERPAHRYDAPPPFR